MPASLPLQTLNGLTIEEMYARLDEQLETSAYRPIAGTHGKDGCELTDIDPNYATEVLNQVFGPCGLGWGYSYEPANIKLTVENRPRSGSPSPRRICLAVLTRLSVWYMLIKADGSTLRCMIDAAGASDNDSEAYALKGAITYAIGNAFSKIGWQRSVYLGLRSHRTVCNSPTPVPPANPTKAEFEATAALPAEQMSLDTLLAYVVPTGSWKGKSMQEVLNTGETGQKAIVFWNSMNAGDDAARTSLKNAASLFLQLSGSDQRSLEAA